MPNLDLIINEDDPNQAGLLSPLGPELFAASIPAFVKGDIEVYCAVKTIKTTGVGLEYSHESGDEYVVAIGNPDEPSTAGEANFLVGATAANSIAYNATAAAFQTIFSAASVTAGFGAVTVTKIKEGAYQLDWDANGSVPNGTITGDESELIPASQIVISPISEGSGSSKAQYIIEWKQQPVALASPDDELTAPSVASSTQQTATYTRNKIVKIALSEGASAGGYSVSVTALGVTEGVGVATPDMSAQDFGILLSNHSNIHYLDQDGTADNIYVRKSGLDYYVEFIGTLAGSTLRRTISDATVANPTVLTTSANHNYADGDTVTITNSTGTTPSLNGTYTITHISDTTFSIPLNVTVASGESARVFNDSQPSISVTNIDLVGPLGVEGTIGLNTINMAKSFFASEEDELTFKLSVKRTRLSGEERTLLLIDVRVKRNLIDLGALVSMPNAIDFLFRRGAVTVSSAGTTELTVPSNCRFYTYRVTVGAGSGVYTRNIDLGVVNQLDGTKVMIILDMAASTNPDIRIRDNGSPTEIYREYSTGAAYVRPLFFTWNNDLTLWQSDQGAT